MTANGKDADQPMTYLDAGVDIDAGNAFVKLIKPLAAATSRKGADGALGGFGGLFDLKAAGFIDPVLVAANDGVGTKLKIAIETGIHKTIGIDLVAMCVNDLIVQGAEPLFFLDYLATGKLDLETARSIIEGVATGCEMSGCALIGGETAEMPGMYHGEDYDLAGFSVGAAERGQLLPRPDIAPGDHIIGLASSGIHSNGYSLVRKLKDKSGIDYKAPAPFTSTCANFGEALLEPTRIYVKSILHVIKETSAIKALAHITGGGLTENIPRVLPAGLNASIDLDKVKLPPVMSWIQTEASLDEREMLKTFNCGIGMVVICPADQSERLIEMFLAKNETAKFIGQIEDGSGVGAGSGAGAGANAPEAAPEVAYNGSLEGLI